MLAAGALIASVLAFGAAPAAIASEEVADAQATWRSCLGPALEDRGFTDVSMDSAHYDSINCLAYYGITSGKTADTYDPGGYVTRSQMALFLTNAAAKAGIDLGDAMDMGFTDLGSTGDNRVAAINALASKGIMPGRTATTFDPTGLVTRVDMAQHLFAMLDLALDSIIIDRLPDAVEGNEDGVGRIELYDDGSASDPSNVAGDGIGWRPDDYFGDVRRTLPAHVDDIVGAVYELGITAGTNGMVGENGEFSPDASVTRGQMATFIMAAMNHTNLRPEGLTAQQTRGGPLGQTQVSVRDADFAPVRGQRIEVMSSSYADDAFNSSGRCISRFVSTFDSNFEGFGKCEIDLGDPETDADGNVTMSPGSSSGPTFECATAGAAPRSADRGVAAHKTYTVETPGVTDLDANYRLWAWTGEVGDEIGANTELVEVGPSNAQTRRSAAVAAVFDGGTNYKVRMGQTLTYTIQLVDRYGEPVGPNPGANHAYNVRIRAVTGGSVAPILNPAAFIADSSPTGLAAGGTYLFDNAETMTPDRNGLITIPVRVPDPHPVTDNADAAVAVRVLNALGNTLPLVDMTGGNFLDRGAAGAAYQAGIDAEGEEFSDNASAATTVRAGSTPWRLHIPGGTNRNTIAVTVLDQYGNPYTGTGLTATGTPAARPAVTSAVSRGTATLSYDGPAAVAGETTTVMVTGPISAPNVVVQWSSRGMAATGGAVGNTLVLDAASREIVVTGPAAYQFGDDDTFIVGTAPSTASLTRTQFQEVLKIAADPTDPRIQRVAATTRLDWSGYNFNRPNDGATWTLSGLTCRRLEFG